MARNLQEVREGNDGDKEERDVIRPWVSGDVAKNVDKEKNNVRDGKEAEERTK